MQLSSRWFHCDRPVVCTRTLAISLGSPEPEQPLAGAGLGDFIDGRHHVLGEKAAYGAIAWTFRNHRLGLFFKLGQFATKLGAPQVSGARFQHPDT